MIGYPTNRLLAVIDDPARAGEALAALAPLRLPPGSAEVLVGDTGVDGLHHLGGAPGAMARLVRMFQFLSMDQMPDFVMYEAALREGRAVVAVRLAGHSAVPAVRGVMDAHGAHFANWFGHFQTEELSDWAGPEPEIPDYLRR
jgi:hypothetical protein